MSLLEYLFGWAVVAFAVITLMYMLYVFGDNLSQPPPTPAEVAEQEESEYYRRVDWFRHNMNRMIYWYDSSTDTCFATITMSPHRAGLTEVECKDDVTYQLFESEGPPK